MTPSAAISGLSVRYYYYYNTSFGSLQGLSCCSYTLIGKFRFILAESHNYAVSTIRRIRNSAQKIDPQFGFLAVKECGFGPSQLSF
jgi:hypothetical protein